MNVLIVQSLQERKNRIPDFSDARLTHKVSRVYGVDEAIASIQDCTPSLVILDVDIEKGTGFKVFENTRNLDYEKVILADKKSHTLKSIRYNVLQSFPKPLKADDLLLFIDSLYFRKKLSSIQQLYENKVRNPKHAILSHIYVPIEDQNVFLKCKDIVYVEDFGTFCLLSMAAGNTIQCQMEIERFHKVLLGQEFELLANGNILNFNQITSFSQNAGRPIACCGNSLRIEIPIKLQEKYQMH